MLNIGMLNVVMLNVGMLNVGMLSVTFMVYRMPPFYYYVSQSPDVIILYECFYK
jgi:hypothetical protein